MQNKKDSITPQECMNFMHHCTNIDNICKIVRDFQTMDKAIDQFKKQSQIRNIDINKKRWCIRKVKRLQKGKKQFLEAQNFCNFVIMEEKFPKKQKIKAALYKAFICLKSWRLAEAQAYCMGIIKIKENCKQAYRCLIQSLDYQLKVRQAQEKLKQFVAKFPNCKWGIQALKKYNYVLSRQPKPMKPILNRQNTEKNYIEEMENLKTNQNQDYTQDYDPYNLKLIPGYHVPQSNKYSEDNKQIYRKNEFSSPKYNPYKINYTDLSTVKRIIETFKDFVQKYIPLFC